MILTVLSENLFDTVQECNTLDKLFKKYPDLSNPEKSGVEFYQFIEPDSEGLDLEVITSLDEAPGSHSFSGFETSEYNPGDYLLHFPYYARTLVFSNIKDIDDHLSKHEGKFELPGF